MTIGPKGYEATQQRVSELLSRVRSMTVPATPQSVVPKPSPAPLQGGIGRGKQVSGSSGFAPFDPFGANAARTTSLAPGELSPMIQSVAEQNGIDPLLFESLVHAESNFNPKVVSNKGAMGLTQLMPGTAKSLGVTDPFDPQQNLSGGARYLAGLLKQFDGDERLALAAYNAGPGAVRRHNGVPPYAETERYVARIMARVKSMRGTE